MSFRGENADENGLILVYTFASVLCKAMLDSVVNLQSDFRNPA